MDSNGLDKLLEELEANDEDNSEYGSSNSEEEEEDDDDEDYEEEEQNDSQICYTQEGVLANDRGSISRSSICQSNENLTKQQAPRKPPPRKSDHDDVFQVPMESLGTINPLLDLLVTPELYEYNFYKTKDEDTIDTSMQSNMEDLLEESEDNSESEMEYDADLVETKAERKKSIGNLLMDMGVQVRNQLSLTNLKQLQQKNTKKFKNALKSITGSVTDINNNRYQDEYPRKPLMKMTDKNKREIIVDEVVCSDVDVFDWDITQHTDPKFKDQVIIHKFDKGEEVICNTEGLITMLPDWISNPVIDKIDTKELLVLAIESKCKLVKQQSTEEWDRAISRGQGLIRDYRRIYIYVTGKIEMPGKNILCMSFSRHNDTLIIGGEKGMLKALEVEHFNVFRKTGNPELKDVSYTIRRHETILGHVYNITQINWHTSGDRFMTSDSSGVIIGWMRGEGLWVAEMVQERSSSTVLGIAWSPDCSRVCFTYQDVDEEEEEIHYGAVMGSADGNPIWTNDLLANSPPFGLHWMDTNKIAFYHDREIVVNHQNGLLIGKKTVVPEDDKEKLGKPIAFLSKPITSSVNAGPFCMAIVWELKRMMLCGEIGSWSKERQTSGEYEQKFLIVHTHLIATCADWSPNGLFIAIGGKPIAIETFSIVKIFNYCGKLLTVVRVDELAIRCLSWDMDSFHLAIGAKSILYLGSVRPVYKFASTSNGSFFAYAFACNELINNYIGFWDTTKINVQKVPGKVVELKSHDERFALLSVNDEGIFCASVINKYGNPIDTLIILTMEPFTVCLTDSCLVCLSTTSIIFWRYKESFSQSLISATSDKTKHTRQIHIDDQPSLRPTVCEMIDDPYKCTLDIAKCMDAKVCTLCVARNSGKLQFYCLPQGGLMYTVEMDKCSPYLLMFNPLADRLAILDVNGFLRYGTVNNFQVEINSTDQSMEVLNLIWAKDMPYHLCVMERTKMSILQTQGDSFEVVEAFNDVHALQGYLAGFDNLQLTLLKLDEILEDPFQPKVELITKIDMKVVKNAEQFFKLGNKHQLSKLMEEIEKKNQPKLWNIMGKGFLKQGEIKLAENAFVRAKNYPAIKLIKSIEELENIMLKKAEIHYYLEEFDVAEEYYVKAGRKDLNLKMWKDLDDSNKVQTLLDCDDDGSGDYQKRSFPSSIIADKYFLNGEFEEALVHYKKINNNVGMFDCYVRMEDFDGLKQLADCLPKDDSLLVKIASTLAGFGMITEAVKVHLKFGNPEIAINICLDNFQWNLALEASHNHNMPIVAQVLLSRTGQLIKSGNIMQAVQFLKICDKTFAAGKLLAMMAKAELDQHKQPNIESVKKLFVMAAMMFCSKPNKILNQHKNGSLAVVQVHVEDDIDFRFDESIPDEMKPSLEDMIWMRETPWRGAHAIQYLIVVHKHIYNGHFGKATKAANYLRTFHDILGEERVNCLLALSAANGENFNVCSGALMKLESLEGGYQYSDIAFELIREDRRTDKIDMRFDCSRCNTTQVDFNNSTCPTCQYRIPVCILTGEILTKETYIWTCKVCGGTADSIKCKRYENCPVCHTSKR